MENKVIQCGTLYDEFPLQTRHKPHIHNHYELFCFLSGSAKYSVEGNIYSLHANDILIMPPGESHYMIITENVPCYRMIMDFSPDAILSNFRSELMKKLEAKPFGEKNYYSAEVFKHHNWIKYFNIINSSDNINEQRLYFTILLKELLDNSHHIQKSETSKDVIHNIIIYINEHLTDNITTIDLCKRFHISRSNTNNRFKEITGFTIKQYITSKRLLLAKELLLKGEKPTQVYCKCGFEDYSSFYRAFTKKFHTSPKDIV